MIVSDVKVDKVEDWIIFSMYGRKVEAVHIKKDGIIHGKLTDAFTGKVTRKDYRFSIVHHPGDKEPVFYLLGGSTGFESFYINSNVLAEHRDPYGRGWCACAGTKNRWDTLEFSGSEMRKALGVTANYSARSIIYWSYRHVRRRFARFNFLYTRPFINRLKYEFVWRWQKE